jgi:hypothetical protein
MRSASVHLRRTRLVAPRLLPALLTCLSALVLLGLSIDHPMAEVTLAVTSLAFPPALVALGAKRRGRIGKLALPLLLLLVLLEGGGLATILLSGQEAGGWLGLSASTAVMLLALGLAPLLLVPLFFAGDFDRFGPSTEDLRRLREKAEGSYPRGASVRGPER